MMTEAVALSEKNGSKVESRELTLLPSGEGQQKIWGNAIGLLSAFL